MNANTGFLRLGVSLAISLSIALPAASQTPATVTAVVTTSLGETIEIGRDPGSKLQLEFPGPTLPAGANIRSVQLHLVRVDGTAAGETVLRARIAPKPAGADGMPDGETVLLFEDRELYEDRGAAKPDAARDCAGPKARVDTLTMTAPDPGAFTGGDTWTAGLTIERLDDAQIMHARTWYAGSAAQAACRPRLVIDYVPPGESLVMQTHARNGVSGTSAFIPELQPRRDSQPNAPRNWLTERIITEALWSHRAIERGDRLFFVEGTLNRPEERRLVATTSMGRRLATLSVPNAGRDLVALPDGAFLLFDTRENVLKRAVFDLSDPGSSTYAPVGPTLDQTYFPPTVPPLRASDGSLIIAGNTAVVGLDPGYRILWEMPLDDERAESMVLGPSERFVYVSTDEPRLIAIDRATGSVRTAPAPVNPDGDLATVAPLAVVAHPDGSERIFMATNTIQTGHISHFVNDIASSNPAMGHRSTNGSLSLLWDEEWRYGPLVSVLPDHRSPIDPNASDRPNPSKNILLIESLSGSVIRPIRWSASEFRESQVEGYRPFAIGELSVIDQSGIVYAMENGFVQAFNDFAVSNPGGNVRSYGHVTPMTEVFFGGEGGLFTKAGSDGQTLRRLVPRMLPAPDQDGRITVPSHAAINRFSANSLAFSSETVIDIGGALVIEAPTTIGPNFRVTKTPGAE